MTDVSGTLRGSLSVRKRLAVFERDRGKCWSCGIRIVSGMRWQIEHVVPLAMGGADDEANMRVSCAACAKSKNAQDFGRIAKAKRQKAKTLGIRKRSTFRGWKNMRGEPVRNPRAERA